MSLRISRFPMFLSVAFFVSIARAAASPAVPVMTLGEALDYAHLHRPEVLAAAARVDDAVAQAAVTQSRWLPSVVGTAQLLATTTNNTTGSYLGASSFDNPRVSATRAETPTTASLIPEASSLFGVSGRQELFDFGQIAAQEAADDLRSDVRRFEVVSTRLLLDFDVEEAYFAVLAARSIVDAAEQAYQRAEVHRDMARAGVDTGLRRPIELTRAEALLDRFDLERVRAQAGLTSAQLAFGASIGIPGRLLDAAGKVPETSDLPSLDVALARAEERNPDLAAALSKLRAQRQETRAIAATERPNLYASGALSGNAGGAMPTSGEAPVGNGLLPLVPNWDIGVVLGWPLYDPGTVARERVSRKAEEVARGDAEAIRLHLLGSVGKAYVAVEASRDALPILQRTVQAAIANADQANARFDVGLGNAVELADAEDLRIAAEIDLAVGRFELNRTRAALARLLAETP
jgi:outer membrane protein